MASFRVIPLPTMSNIHERLKQARIAAGYKTSSAAAEAFGINPNTLRSNENGNKPYGRDAATKYAKIFNVRLEWLLSGKGSMRSVKGRIPVEGYVGAGAAVFPLDDGAFDPIEPPFGVPDGAIAFVVRGDSMYPAYREGTYIIAMPVSDVRDLINRRAVVTLDDGRRYVKDIGAGSRPDTFTLYSHNASPIHDVRIVAAATVLGTKEPA